MSYIKKAEVSEQPIENNAGGVPPKEFPKIKIPRFYPRKVRDVSRTFNHVTNLLREHGALVGTAHRRILVPKSKLTEQDLFNLHFVPVSVAIPEAGQNQFQSYRHPSNLFHIHSHPEGWTIHEDRHPAATMIARGVKGLVAKSRAMAQGVPHISDEGLPGLYYYLKGQLTRSGSTAQHLLKELHPKLLEHLNRLPDAPTANEDKIAYDRGAYTALALFHKTAGIGHPYTARISNTITSGLTGALLNTAMAPPGDRLRQGGIGLVSDTIGGALGPWGMLASPAINMSLQQATAPTEIKQADHADDRLKERIKAEFPPDTLAKLRAQATELHLAPGKYYLPLKNKAGNTTAIAAFKTVDPDDRLILATILTPKKHPPAGTSLSHLMKQPLNKVAEETEPSLLQRYGAPALGLAAGLGTYTLARKFRPSMDPRLRALQEQAKNKKFEVATSYPAGRGLRSWLFGARDIPHRSDIKDPAFQAQRPNSTILHHTPNKGDTSGGVNINTGVLPDYLDDKHTFHQLMTQGTGGGTGLEGAVPETQLLRDVLRKYQGNYAKLQKDIGHDYVIKPRTGSMSKAENLLTRTTDIRTPRLQQAIQNPSEFILQQKIPIEKEYRVHMINGVPFTAAHRQIPHEGLRRVWDKSMGGGGGAFVPVMGDERKRLMQFAEKATHHLGKTPTGTNILGQSENLHHALDVAKLQGGGYKVIESNPTPGTLMNPVTSHKLQQMVTGRIPKDIAALGALGVGGATSLGARKLLNTKEDEKEKPKTP